MLCLVLLSSVILLNAQSKIEWFKSTLTHQENIQLLSTGWVSCPDWDPSAGLPGAGAKPIEIDAVFGPRIRIEMPEIPQAVNYSFIARCITLKVPLNWDDANSTDLINYHLARIFPQNPPSSDNGAFWMLNGGPGGEGAQLYPTAIPWLTYMDGIYDQYIPDHRGTGYSNPIQCPIELDQEGCVTYINDTYGNDINYFSTYAASLDLGYTIDLFMDGLDVYNSDDQIIYGISYGTYYLNTYLNLFPDQVNATIFDGLCPPDKCRFIDYDNGTNIVGNEFMDLCGNEEFCSEQLSEDPYQILGDLYEKMGNNTDGIVPCIDIGTFQPPILKNLLFFLIIDVPTRELIPAIVFRMNRCNDGDRTVLNNLFTNIFSFIAEFEGGNMTNMVGVNIAVSEMWNGLDPNDPGASYEELFALDENYYISAAVTYTDRSWWGIWNRYIPNEDTYGIFADPDIPMLLLHGDLDPQTPIWWGLHSAEEYGTNIDESTVNDDDRYFYTIPTAPHFTMFRSPLVNMSDEYDFETCGFMIMKSFIDNGMNDGNWIPNTDCTKWILPIDFEGTTEATKLTALGLFNTSDLWGIEQDSEEESTDDTHNKAIKWIIVIGVINALIH